MKRVPFSTLIRGKVLGICLILFSAIIFVGLASAQSSSPYAGSYSGEWVASLVLGATFSDGESQHVGTWDISIDASGTVEGIEFDKTSGNKGTIKGFIDEDGFIKVFIKYSKTTTIRGSLDKRGTRLTGTLKQTCVGSNDVCANIDMMLTRK